MKRLNDVETGTSRALLRAAAGLVTAWTTAGCFSYVPVAPAAVPVNEEVRVHVTEEAAIRVARDLGAFRNMVEGTLTPLGEDSVSVSVWIGRDYPGTAFEDVHRAVSLGRTEVVEVRRRRVSTVRTGLASAGVLAVFAILIDRVVLREDPNPGGDGPPPPPPPEGIRIPLGWIF